MRLERQEELGFSAPEPRLAAVLGESGTCCCWLAGMGAELLWGSELFLTQQGLQGCCSCSGAARIVWSILEHRTPESLRVQNPSRAINSIPIPIPIPTSSPARSMASIPWTPPGWAPLPRPDRPFCHQTLPGVAEWMLALFPSAFLCLLSYSPACGGGCQRVLLQPHEPWLCSVPALLLPWGVPTPKKHSPSDDGGN